MRILSSYIHCGFVEDVTVFVGGCVTLPRRRHGRVNDEYRVKTSEGGETQERNEEGDEKKRKCRVVRNE